MSPEANKVLEIIEATPYQGEGTFSIACEFRAWKGYGDENPEYYSLVQPYILELKKAGQIYRSACNTYGTMWVASRYRSLNDALDAFIGNGKARSVLRHLQIRTVEELTQLKAQDLLAIRGCGEKTVRLIIEALAGRGLSLLEGLKSRSRICPHCGKEITRSRQAPSMRYPITLR